MSEKKDQENCPYKLEHKIDLPTGADLRTLSFFPWKKQDILDFTSARHVPDERRPSSEDVSRFYALWGDAVAVAGRQHLFIMFVLRLSTRRPIRISLPADSEREAEGNVLDSTQVAWRLKPSNILEPLILCTLSSVLVIYNLKTMQLVGCLRGHGGPITSIVVHPKNPFHFCTTSRDHSTRLYDLTRMPQEEPTNDSFPPHTQKNLAGAALGFQMNEPEGMGMGRCVCVFVGGRSGGHKAAVMHAAFHPYLPLIATAGLDRVVKIWRIPTHFGAGIVREDKPLFSSSKIHQSAVLSINWLDPNVLVSHSAPSLLRSEELAEPTVGMPNVAIWRWMSLPQFFPLGQEEAQLVLRGSTADYLESSSFRFIANYSLPSVSSRLTLARLSISTSKGRPYLVFTYPELRHIRMIALSSLSPRPVPPFPWDLDKLPTMEEIREGQEALKKFVANPLQPTEGWVLATRGRSAALENCAMGLEGACVVGIHDKSVWVWKRYE